MATNAEITVTVLPSTLDTVLVSTGDPADVVLEPRLDDARLRAGEEAELHRLQVGEERTRAPMTLLPMVAVR